MFCKKCGRSLNESDKFCLDCGTPVDQEVPVTEVEAPVSAPVTKKKFKLWIPIVALVAVVGIVVGLLVGGVFASPEMKLAKAIVNSVNAWKEVEVLKAEDLTWMVNGKDEYSGEYQIWLEDFPDLVMMEGFGIRATFDVSLPQRQLNMVMAPNYGYTDIVHAQLLVQDNEMYIGSQELTKDAYYMIRTDILGQEINALGGDMLGLDDLGFNIFDILETLKQTNVDNQEALKNLTQVFNTMVEQILVEELESGTRMIHGTEMKTDCYKVVVPKAAVSAFMDALEPIYMAQASTDSLMEIYKAMGMDEDTLAILEMELRAATADSQEVFAGVRKAFEDMGDLEYLVSVSNNYVVAVDFSVTYEEVTVDFAITLGGGENYADYITISGYDQDGEGFQLVSEGDHVAKSGTFTDKTVITISEETEPVVVSELSYVLNGDLAWTLTSEDISLDMKGQLKVTGEEFYLRLDELALEEYGYALGTFGVEYRMGAYAPAQVDVSNHKVLAEMTDSDMTAAYTSLMSNAMEWLSWVQENFPELVNMLMYL